MLTLLEWPISAAIMLATGSFLVVAWCQVVGSLVAPYSETMRPSRKADVTEFISAICLAEEAKMIVASPSLLPFPFGWVWSPPWKTLNSFVLYVPASLSTFTKGDMEDWYGSDKNILNINTGPSLSQSLRSYLLHHW